MGIPPDEVTSKGKGRAMVQRLTVSEADGDYVEFWSAGSHAKGEFRCADCGYGAIVTAALPRCPMCGCESWEPAGWSPFSRAALGRDARTRARL
jgi:hypothetical protein